MRLKLFPVLSLLIIAALVLSGCASQPATEAPGGEVPATEEPATEEPMAEKTFTIGVLGPFTGPSARTGDEFRISSEMALEAIDYKIGDYTLNVVWIDSQSDPEKATRAYEEAIVQDGVQAGVLNWHSSVAVAVMEVTAKHKVPHFFGFGATEVVNEKFDSDPAKYGYWTSKGWPTPVKLTVNYVEALEDAIARGVWTPEAKTVAIYGEDTDWGRSFGEGIAGQLEDAGWEVVDRQYFPIEQTEFYATLNKFKDEGVALIAGTSTAPPSISAFIKQAQEVGLDSMIIADGLGWVGEWYDLTGDASNYVLDQIPGFATQAAKDFAVAFEERSGLQPSPSSGGLSYDGMNFFIKVLQTAYLDFGELTSETVYQTVQDKVWTGELVFTADDGAIVMQEYNFSNPPDPKIGGDYYTFPVLQYMDGDQVYIFPPSIAESDLMVP
ncbi:MAG: ABC transporter substrate-binding protein [Anaerolineales bacterium]|jgi:branched-chain amino acid transport system substrate-binding protein